MIELPEAITMARQIEETLKGKTILSAEYGENLHKFLFFNEDIDDTCSFLIGETVEGANGLGGFVEIDFGKKSLAFNDGTRCTFHRNKRSLPDKWQLKLEFIDRSFLIFTVVMYGGLFAFEKGDFSNPYFAAAKEKPSPLSSEFDSDYFDQLICQADKKQSLKGFLATKQTIPGIGNGTLQDILFNAGLNPKRKLGSLSDDEQDRLFESVKDVLDTMTKAGGRDTEKDLFGSSGGYRLKLSKKTYRAGCPACGTEITKQAYMGGSVYFCPVCQPLLRLTDAK